MKVVIFSRLTHFMFANMTVQKLNVFDFPVFIVQENRDSSQKVNTDLATEDAKKLFEVRSLITAEISILQAFHI